MAATRTVPSSRAFDGGHLRLRLLPRLEHRAARLVRAPYLGGSPPNGRLVRSIRVGAPLGLELLDSLAGRGTGETKFLARRLLKTSATARRRSTGAASPGAQAHSTPLGALIHTIRLFRLLTNTDSSGSIVQLFTKGTRHEGAGAARVRRTRFPAQGLYDPAPRARRVAGWASWWTSRVASPTRSSGRALLVLIKPPAPRRLRPASRTRATGAGNPAPGPRQVPPQAVRPARHPPCPAPKDYGVGCVVPAAQRRAARGRSRG